MSERSDFQSIERGARKVLVPATPIQTAEMLDVLARHVEEHERRIRQLEQIVLRPQIADNEGGVTSQRS